MNLDRACTFNLNLTLTGGYWLVNLDRGCALNLNRGVVLLLVNLERVCDFDKGACVLATRKPPLKHWD